MKEFESQEITPENSILLSPCYNHLGCNSYTTEDILPEVTNYPDLPVKLVGHYSISEVERVLEARPSAQLTCLTQLREPIIRTLSCLYYRTKEKGRARLAFTYVNIDLFTDALKNFKDMYGHGCNNEILRMFAGDVDEETLSTLDPTSQLANDLVEKAKRNMEKCVVLLSSQAESNEAILNHWFPSMSALREGINSTRMNTLSTVEKLEMIDPWYLRVVMVLNELDGILYEYGVQLHQRLYQVALEEEAKNNQTVVIDVNRNTR